jgi:hypothetical protein
VGSLAFWILAAGSVLAGVAMLWVFRVTSDQRAIKALKRRRSAYLLEMRLFGDEPSLIWRAQKALVAANLRYIVLMMRPFVVLIAPMILLFVQLDAIYGKRPLAVGEAALITVQVDGEPAEAPPIAAPEGLAVEGPPVRAIEDRQIVWRVRPKHPLDGGVKIGGQEKRIVAGEGTKYLAARRVRSWGDWFWEPVESRLPEGPVRWIEVSYPSSGVRGLGVELHWLIWFFAISMIAALALRGRMKVTF